MISWKMSVKKKIYNLKTHILIYDGTVTMTSQETPARREANHPNIQILVSTLTILFAALERATK
jgi:hypothetical protein